jgi:hypothetical protein
LKYSLEVDLLFFLSTIQKGVCTTPPLEEEAHVPTSNGLGRRVNLNHLLLLFLIRMGESPITT